MIRAILVDAAGGCPVPVFLQERAFEKNLATRAATVAFAATERKLCDDLLLAKVCADEATQFALRLARAEFRVRDFARTNTPGQARFEWERLANKSFVIS